MYTFDNDLFRLQSVIYESVIQPTFLIKALI